VPGARLRTVTQTSAGGVVYRRPGAEGPIDVALVRVGPKNRWQLPKGLVEHGEAPEATAVREVREEAGVHGELIAPLEAVEYWYVGSQGGNERVRFHKRVHFFLLEYREGDVEDHDDEVSESRWVPIDDAEAMLAFSSERNVMARARELLKA
jgi:8-oxo-dGTP pyrophosphatase MutT (NUDIX family)